MRLSHFGLLSMTATLTIIGGCVAGCSGATSCVAPDAATMGAGPDALLPAGITVCHSTNASPLPLGLAAGVTLLIVVALVALTKRRRRRQHRRFQHEPDRLVPLHPSLSMRESLAQTRRRHEVKEDAVSTSDTWPPVVTNVRDAQDVMLDLIFACSIPKDLHSSHLNEDAWILESTGSGAAVFDGATESFAARRWARLLATTWATGRDDWYVAAQAAYLAGAEDSSLSWAQEAAAARGSFATIAAVRGANDHLDVTCVGDSCAILVSPRGIVASHPLANAEDFTSSPMALPSDPTHRDRIQELLAESTIAWAVTAIVTEVWLATDAVAAWLLASDPLQRAERSHLLQALRTTEEFLRLIDDQRAHRAMRIDDCTFVRLRIRGNHDLSRH